MLEPDGSEPAPSRKEAQRDHITELQEKGCKQKRPLKDNPPKEAKEKVPKTNAEPGEPLTLYQHVKAHPRKVAMITAALGSWTALDKQIECEETWS